MEQRTWKWFQSLNAEQRDLVRALPHDLDPASLQFNFHEPLPESLPGELEPESVLEGGLGPK